MEENNQNSAREGEVQSDAKDVQENKVLAAISYLWVLSIVMLLVKRDSKFVQFHAKQATVLFGISIVMWILSIMFTFMFLFSPFLVVLGFVWWIIGLIIFVLSIVGLVKAAQGEFYKLPIIGAWAESLKF